MHLHGMVLIFVHDSVLLEKMMTYLGHAGINIKGVSSAQEFRQEILNRQYVIALMDVDHSDQPGFVLVEHARKNTDLRIILLTSRSSPTDKLLGYKSGADIYMVKPVEPLELSAIVFSILRRINSAHRTEQKVMIWKLDSVEWVLVDPDGAKIKLTTKEYEFLRCFVWSNHKPLQRKDILVALEYQLNEHSVRALEVLVYRLRRKASIKHALPLKTVHGTGFCFVSPIILL